MHNTEDIALVVQSGITESVISINFVNGSADMRKANFLPQSEFWV